MSAKTRRDGRGEIPAPIRKGLAGHRLERAVAPSVAPWRRAGAPGMAAGHGPRDDVVLDCGWGRLIFGHTFRESRRIAAALADEAPCQRDIAFYLPDPHVVLSFAPQSLFLDPSHTYRLWLDRYRPAARGAHGFSIRRAATATDAAAIDRIFTARRMASIKEGFVVAHRDDRTIVFLVAEDADGIVGTATGVDHVRAFDDPEGGSSLWCLAVDPQAREAGIGEALVRHLAETFIARGRAFLDLSVMHDNAQAIRLYEKLGFRRVPVFALKNKNSVNERLFIGPAPDTGLNPFARIIVDEARRRGIAVEVLDAEAGYFRLTLGARSTVCRESLSELTTAIAMSRCDDKAVTHRVLAKAGLAVPEQTVAAGPGSIRAFLSRHPRIVVKPARGEQGGGVSVDLGSPEEIAQAIERARRYCETVLLEQFIAGQDLRILAIGFEVVAAAVRRPAAIVGDGALSVRQLIEKQSRRRAAATGGESRIPIDSETRRCLRAAGLSLEDIPESGREIMVRRTANLHTGGTIHDVTERLHPTLAEAAIKAARALDIPVVGLDFMVRDPAASEYVVIEANERPGLANHEPQPTAERFVDLLFPHTASRRTNVEPRRAGAG